MKLFNILLGVLLTSQCIVAQSYSEKIISKEAVVNSSIENAWEKWTTIDGLTSFFAADAKIEIKPNGPFEVYFSKEAPVGQRGSESCKVLAVVPNKLLSFTWTVPPSFPKLRESGQKTIVSVLFEKINTKQTKVTLINYGYPQDAEWEPVITYFESAWTYVMQTFVSIFPKEDNSLISYIAINEPIERLLKPEGWTASDNALFGEHFNMLKDLQKQGIVQFAGPSLSPEKTFGIVVFKAMDLRSAQEIRAMDPIVRSGLVTEKIYPFKLSIY